MNNLYCAENVETRKFNTHLEALRYSRVTVGLRIRRLWWWKQKKKNSRCLFQMDGLENHIAVYLNFLARSWIEPMLEESN